MWSELLSRSFGWAPIRIPEPFYLEDDDPYHVARIEMSMGSGAR